MSTIIKAKQYLLNNYATWGPVNLNYDTPEATFKYNELEYDLSDANLLKPGEILVESIHLSNDPAQKGWFKSNKDSYLPPSPLGKPAPARGVGKVLKSNNDKYKEGDFVQAHLGWTTHSIFNADEKLTSKLDLSKVSKLSQFLSVFGSTTLTAYVAAYKYSELTPKDTDRVFLVSGAAGAVGSVLVQILAKDFKPKKVLAIAGGADKVKFVESLGPNVIGIDYKSSTYEEDFAKALGDDKIDVFFDQVAGEILDHASQYLKTFGKIVQIGAISGYNDPTKSYFKNYAASILHKRLRIQGFVVIDDFKDSAKIIAHLEELFQNGTLDKSKFHETIVDATGDNFVKIPELWTGLFTGTNKGKFITTVAKGYD
ncbi:hypothetical protein WICMUC_003987 [Wickerhamomyces mucosus]|uniref:Enoyl reductase (ER) domain-containing protein n=1 Tax=Wickerhamomyces mucosus TaxID=1378264 RepID=A0A9P8PJS4_9ASCO|nr:hypothetical protein WICMUC_003987 [Wickerhamomyces mucosus]